MDMKKLIEAVDQFAGQAVGQKPGDQVRGTEKATKRKDNKHPFAGRLVGASEGKSLLADLEKELVEGAVKRSLAEEFAAFKEQSDDMFAQTERPKHLIAASKWKRGGDVSGTGFRGYVLTDYNTIVKTFGEPYYVSDDPDDKVPAEWVITFKDGKVATIYVYKTKGVVPKEPYRWHVGGNSTDMVERVAALLGTHPEKDLGEATEGFGRNVYFRVGNDKLELAQAVGKSIPFYPTNKPGYWKFSIMKNARPEATMKKVEQLEQFFGPRAHERELSKPVVGETRVAYDKRTGQMGVDNADPDQRHGLYINGKLIKTVDGADAANNLKKRDPRFKDATVKKIAESDDMFADRRSQKIGAAIIKAGKGAIADAPISWEGDEDMIEFTIGDGNDMIKIGKTYIEQGMAAGNAAFWEVDTAVRDQMYDAVLDVGIDMNDILDDLDESQGVAEEMTPAGEFLNKQERLKAGDKVYYKGRVVGIATGDMDDDRVVFKPVQGYGTNPNFASLPIDLVSLRESNQFSDLEIAIMEGGNSLEELTEGRIMHSDSKVNVFYKPGHNQTKAQMVARMVPNSQVNRIIASLVNKFGVKSTDFEWQPSDRDQYKFTNEGDEFAEPHNPQDVVTMDIPLLIRLFEYAREDAKTDMDLHNVAERLIKLSSEGQTLSMDQYDQICPSKEQTVDEDVPPAVATAGGPAGANQPKTIAPAPGTPPAPSTAPVDPAQQALQKQNQAKLQQNLANLKSAGVQIDPAKAAQTLQKTDTGAPMNAMDKDTIAQMAPAIGNVMSNPSTATQLNTLIKKAGGGV